jgi:hypothetical protein
LNRNGVPTHHDLLTGAVSPRRERRPSRAPTVEERRALRVVRSRAEDLRELLAKGALAEAAVAKASAHCEALAGRWKRRNADAEDAEGRAAALQDAIGGAPDAVTAATEARRATDAARAARARSTARGEELALARQDAAKLVAERAELARKADAVRALLAAEGAEKSPPYASGAAVSMRSEAGSFIDRSAAAEMATEAARELAQLRAERDQLRAERAELAQLRAERAAGAADPDPVGAELAELLRGAPNGDANPEGL